MVHATVIEGKGSRSTVGEGPVVLPSTWHIKPSYSACRRYLRVPILGRRFSFLRVPKLLRQFKPKRNLYSKDDYQASMFDLQAVLCFICSCILARSYICVFVVCPNKHDTFWYYRSCKNSNNLLNMTLAFYYRNTQTLDATSNPDIRPFDNILVYRDWVGGCAPYIHAPKLLRLCKPNSEDENQTSMLGSSGSISCLHFRGVLAAARFARGTMQAPVDAKVDMNGYAEQ